MLSSDTVRPTLNVFISIWLLVSVCARPWEGDRGILYNDGEEARLCADVRCSAQQGLSAYMCYLQHCASATSTMLQQKFEICLQEEVKIDDDDEDVIGDGTCRLAQCLQHHLQNGLVAEALQTLTDAECHAEQQQLDDVSCFDTCKEMAATDRYYAICVQTFCMNEAASASKRVTTRMNGCKTAADCQVELMGRVGKRVSSRFNNCKTAECVMQMAGLNKKWTPKQAKRVSSRVNGCQDPQDCARLFASGKRRTGVEADGVTAADKRASSHPQLPLSKRMSSRLNGCQTAQECERILLGANKRMSSRLNGCRNSAECQSQIIAALGGK